MATIDEERFTVVMPDGTEIEAPAGTTKAQLQAKWEGYKAKEPSPMEKLTSLIPQGVKDNFNNVKDAAIRGPLMLPALAHDGLEAAGEWVGGKLNPPDPRLAGLAKPQRKGAVDLVNELAPYKPKTTGQKYASSVVEGVTGSLVGPGSLLRKAMIGAAAGGGGEAGGQMTETKANPDGHIGARVLGSLAGGLGTAGLASFGGTKADLAKLMLERLTPADLAKGKATQALARSEGLPLALNQALPDSPELNAMVEALAKHKTGVKVKEVLGAQPGQVVAGAQKRITDLPGARVKPPSAVANDLQQGATDKISKEMKARTEAVRGPYAAAGELGEDVTKSVIKSIDDYLTQPDLSETATGVAKKLKDSLTNNGPKVTTMGPPELFEGIPIVGSGTEVTTNFRTHAAGIKASLDDALSDAKNPNLYSQSPKAQGEVKHLAAFLYQQLGEKSPEIAKANVLYKQITEDTISPLRKSVTGDMAGLRGALDDKNSPKGISNGLFKGENPRALDSNINTLANDLKKTAPMAVPDAFKSHLSDALATTKPGENVAADLTHKLFGTVTQKTAMNRGLAVVEDANRLPAGSLSAGFKRWAGIVELAAKRPHSLSGLSEGEIGQVGSQNAISRGLGIFTIAPFAGPRDTVSKLYLDSALKQMDSLLTSPEGIDMLVKLSKQSTSKKMANGLVNSWLATVPVAAQGTTEVPKRKDDGDHEFR